MTRRALEKALQAAHAAGDGARLARLYARAADTAPDVETAGFMLTQAYVFALECGDAMAPALHSRLCRTGREI